MVETDWREILSFSQKELTQSDKEKLCESLCWMEADDIELNFTDLKTLFRLAQDILKLKSEQVNNIVGQLKSAQRKSGKMKVESTYAVSPTQSNDSALETITHQEEIIKANKEILEQLYADIADLESRKSKLEGSRSNFDIDSDSSRDVLSEMNAVAELEQQVSMKNKHIRKLLSDVKILEEENTKLKDKVSVLKEKLTEATQLIDNLTEQLLAINNECSQLKEILGKSVQAKSQLSIEIERLRKELLEKESNRENIYDEIKSKVLHWKNIARSKKAELEVISNENLQLKENLKDALKVSSSPKKNDAEKQKIKELQDKLLEASNEIEQTANLINLLRTENKQLRSIIDEVPECSVSEARNVSDDGKERTIINKLKKKVKNLTISLQGAEEMIGIREKELTEITSQLQLLRSDEGINALLEGLKNKKRQLRFKDEGIKNLVQETNTLNQLINDLQLENEALRQMFDIPPDEKVPIKGIMKDYRNLQQTNSKMIEELKRLENNLVGVELNNRNLSSKIQKMTKLLKKSGYSKDKIDKIIQDSESDDGVPTEAQEELPTTSTKELDSQESTADNQNQDTDMVAIIEENKGLRKGLQEILDFLKDNSKTSSGVLTLQCPSLEAILLSIEARNTAGWFAPHMSTVMELRAALGGKDALLTALHEARKETFDVMAQLTDATKKSSELEKRLNEIVLKNKQKEAEEKLLQEKNVSEFGSWMSEKEQNDVDFYDKSQIDKLTEKGNFLYECQLKKGLEYFHMKFRELFDKLTSMAIRASDDLNKWSIQEENYKAEIEGLKSQVQQDDEEFSDCSPGIIPMPNFNFLQRKCSYLEESYKYIRTLNENMKNDILESKRDALIAASEYETQYQKMLLSVAHLTDKLRHSISLDLFLKQNIALNEIILKYRRLIENGISNRSSMLGLSNRLEEEKVKIINWIRLEYRQKNGNESNEIVKKVESDIELMVLKKQIQQICRELEDKNNKIENLEKQNLELHEVQLRIIDESLASVSKQEVELMKEQLHKLSEDNKLLKEQCQHVSNQLDIALLQLQDNQQRQMSNDMEINMLQHQILDLQSVSDNKAIIARLSSEILVAHLQVSESQKRIDRLHLTLNKERELKNEAEDMLRARQRIFDVYAMRYDSKFRYMYEIMQTLRQQYQGCIPLMSIEKYLNNVEDISRKNKAVEEKLSEIEDLQASLITKHSVFDQVLDVTKNKCILEEDSCPHKLKYIMMQSVNSRELDHVNKKLRAMEQSREDLIKHCNYLEKTLVLVNQGFEKYKANGLKKTNSHDSDEQFIQMELEDVQSEDESTPRRSETVTLSKPQVLQKPNNTASKKEVLTTVSPVKAQQTKKSLELKDVAIQTLSIPMSQKHQLTQTTENSSLIDDINYRIEIQKKELDTATKQLYEAMTLAQKRTEEILVLNREKISFESTLQNLKESNSQKDVLNEKLRFTIDELRKQLNEFKAQQIAETNQAKDSVNEENKSLLLALKQLENDKNAIMVECKELLNNEREEYAKSVKELHVKIMELQSKLDRRSSEVSSANGEALKEVVTKYTMKIAELEDKCFKLQSELDECKSELTTYQSEAERWKDLAAERLTKMEQLNSQLEERHCHEVKSYKAENEHWLSQLNDMQREHMDLRSRLTEQKTVYLKQLSDKDTQIEHLRIIINNLKTQIMNMQTLISVNDPSFDLSAIVEVDETSDAMSQHGSDRLELKFESTVDLHDSHDDVVRIPASSTSIWQEPVIERLRREKQLASKQNAILRRQIKVLASRERRARLDAQNLKNQIFRISTTGNKVTTAETAALHNKIASLQAQLTSARRETNSSIALWDKWKRFPLNELMRIKWVEIIRKQRKEEFWQPNKASKICSKHFKDEDKYTSNKGLTLLKKTAIPAIDSEELPPAVPASPNSLAEEVLSDADSIFDSLQTAALKKSINKLSFVKQQMINKNRNMTKRHKRAQQSADRWQSRYDEKCQEVTKLEAGLSLVKSAMSRLEREKRLLLARVNEVKNDNQLIAIEKQESESQEKLEHTIVKCEFGSEPALPLPVSSQALLDRVEAQQRRIAALEVAEKGNELLVSEYERSLAEITSLKGQVLKLESTLLESQIRTPIKSSGDTQPELDYWKSYCEMLKEENVQLTQKINSLETSPITAHQHKVSDLEQTVLTLRGVINKLQAEHKSGGSHKRVDSRPNSSRSGSDKSRTHNEANRIEIINLKRTIHDKDLLLERSKEMLKIAAEREDELLRETAYLRRQLEDITGPKGGFISS